MLSVPNCSVVICTRDRPEPLDRCIRAVLNQDYPRFDVLVVDNAPTNGKAREIAAGWNARYTVEPVPGLSRARNRGLRECQSEIVAYLDDDAIAESGWLAGLAEEFKDPRVMVVAGRVVPLAAPSPEALTCASITDRGLRRRSLDRGTPGWFAAANFGGIGGGGNMAVRTSALQVWSGFNPRLGRGGRVPAAEENYAFFELIAAGYRFVYTPAAVVRHHSPQSLSELRERHLRLLTECGAYLAFLLAELPEYRSLILKLMLARVGSGLRLSDQPAGDVRPRLSPLWSQAYAALSGVIGYACTRWQATPGGSSGN